MNVLLISQCHKNALKESRRILDQFAERRGDRTWQTPITQAGLTTLHKLLRKTARKNTAIACHWIRGRDHSELLWIVGDASRFNTEGAVPTNTTRRAVLKNQDENDWHSLAEIHLLAALAALLHDLGKACDNFQSRLHEAIKQDNSWKPEKNLYRHEWISLRLFQAFVGPNSDDPTWLQRLIEPSEADDQSWLARLQKDGTPMAFDAPLASLPPLAQAVGWLVLTHHRLPVRPIKKNGEFLWLGAKDDCFRAAQLDNLLSKIRSDWNEIPNSQDPKKISSYWRFNEPLPVLTPLWRKRAAKLAERLLDRLQQPRNWTHLQDPYIMHLSRLALMLADHHYSSLHLKSERTEGEANYPLFANTHDGALNQPLDEHLLGVEKHAGTVVHAFARFEQHLPRLGRHQTLQRRSTVKQFAWQNPAADLASGLRERSRRQGAFIVNMASTGCGKTLANARIMYALADPLLGMRCAFALGLRTLTLQTGGNFRDLLSLSEDELAIRVGGKASRDLFEHQLAMAEKTGSASQQTIFPEDQDNHILFEGNFEQPLLRRVLHNPNIRKLLAAPVLVCTVDHLTPATESQRGGHQIAPMLRLMSGDLVLDELDDFDLDDLPALTRLVYWAGLLGSRVLISSATLPPALVQGMYLAYRAGRANYQMHRGERPGEPVDICCAWVDEFSRQAKDCPDGETFEHAHQDFASKRHKQLQKEVVRRRCRLVMVQPVRNANETLYRYFAKLMLEQAQALHAQHCCDDPHSGKKVSFGLIRMANIEPLYEVALAIYQASAPSSLQIHLCVYHSQYPLLLRSAIEQRLDAALNRKKENAVFDLQDIRQRIDSNDRPNQIFIVLGSPVTEVGRDHDYDWAIVEPSSMRSLIQLAGRVRRHRESACSEPNIALLDSNFRNHQKPGEAAFKRPGFEDESHMLRSHHLSELLEPERREIIDARPRILAKPKEHLKPQNSLVDLEHARLADVMLPKAAPTKTSRRQAVEPPKLNAASCYQIPLVHLTGVLAQQQPFREQTHPQDDLVLLLSDEQNDYVLTRIADARLGTLVPLEGKNHRLDDTLLQNPNVTPWGATRYLDELDRLAEARELEPAECARKYGTVSLSQNEAGWRFHPALGFSLNRQK